GERGDSAGGPGGGGGGTVGGGAPGGRSWRGRGALADDTGRAAGRTGTQSWRDRSDGKPHGGTRRADDPRRCWGRGAILARPDPQLPRSGLPGDRGRPAGRAWRRSEGGGSWGGRPRRSTGASESPRGLGPPWPAMPAPDDCDCPHVFRHGQNSTQVSGT